MAANNRVRDVFCIPEGAGCTPRLESPMHKAQPHSMPDEIFRVAVGRIINEMGLKLIYSGFVLGLLSDYYGDQVCYGKPIIDKLGVKTADGCFKTIGASVAHANIGGETRVSAGVHISDTYPDNGTAAMAAVAWADTVVLCVGIDHSQERESLDRKSMALPAAQLSFAERVLAAGKHVILIVVNGGSLSIDTLVSADVIIEAFYPNSAGAQVIGPAIFGVTNRWGRLPYTIYPSSYQEELAIQDMQMQASKNYPGRGYRYYTGKPLFEFGDGLSLTTFSRSCTPVNAATGMHVTCNVTNTGARAGDDVVLLFHRPPPSATPAAVPDQVPIRRLVDFARIFVAAKGTATVDFVIPNATLTLVDREGTRYVLFGEHVQQPYVRNIFPAFWYTPQVVCCCLGLLPCLGKISRRRERERERARRGVCVWLYLLICAMAMVCACIATALKVSTAGGTRV